MRWFKHLTNAHDGKDLTKVRMKFGAEGYAVYWYCLELVAGDLGEQGDVTFELKHDAEVIAFNLRMDSLRVEEIMRFMVDLGLFEASRGTISCLKLAKYLDKNFTRNKKIHKIIDQSKRLETVSRQTETSPDRLSLSQVDEMRGDENRSKHYLRNASCAERQGAPAPTFICLPLNDKSEYGITEDQIQQWDELYPAIDVKQELRKMRGWLDANPKNRKTHRGILRFITNWLSREQDRARPVGAKNATRRNLSAAERTRRDSAEYVRRNGNAWAEP